MVNLNDLGIILQIIGIIIALSSTRYLFHIAIIIHIIYQNWHKIFPKIDFGHPKTLSEYFLMNRVYTKAKVSHFMKYFRNILKTTNFDEMMKTGYSNIMIMIGVSLVIIGLILQLSMFAS